MADELLDLSKLSQDNRIKLVGIIMTLVGICVTGCFGIGIAFIQRPSQKVESNPTQVILLINATPIPSVTPFPTFTPIGAIATVAPAETIIPSPTVSIIQTVEPNTNSSVVKSSTVNYWFPWSNFLINTVSLMPPNTWSYVFISFGAFGLILVTMLLYGIQIQGYSSDKETVRKTIFWVGLVILSILSIARTGWWSILIIAAYIVLLTFNYLFGAAIGVISGTVTGISISLFYLAIPGPMDGGYITAGSIIGGILGIALGAILIKGNFTDADGYSTWLGY
jgi:hypothetical protein